MDVPHAGRLDPLANGVVVLTARVVELPTLDVDRPAGDEMVAAALGGFEQLGAASWAERARRELAATGGKRISAADVLVLLTPHELQVAALVRKGVTNKQAAGALFVSPKTIEYHLANIYAKVGVRSRTELSHFLSTNDV